MCACACVWCDVTRAACCAMPDLTEVSFNIMGPSYLNGKRVKRDPRLMCLHGRYRDMVFHVPFLASLHSGLRCWCNVPMYLLACTFTCNSYLSHHPWSQCLSTMQNHKSVDAQ